MTIHHLEYVLPEQTLTYLPGSGGFRPKSLYVDGERVEGQARDDEGKPLWVHRGARVELQGKVYDGVNIEVASAVEPKVETSGLFGAAQLGGPVTMLVREGYGSFSGLAVVFRGSGAIAAKPVKGDA